MEVFKGNWSNLGVVIGFSMALPGETLACSLSLNTCVLDRLQGTKIYSERTTSITQTRTSCRVSVTRAKPAQPMDGHGEPG